MEVIDIVIHSLYINIFIKDYLWPAFIFVFIAIMLSYIYYRLVETVFKNTILNRLTKSSFDLDPFSILELSFSYFIILISYLILYAYTPLKANYAPYSWNSIIIFGFTITFIGRAITKFKGAFYGRIYYSALFISTLIVIIFNFFMILPWNAAIIKYLIELPIYISKFLDTFYILIIWSFLGSIFLATIGELILSLSKESDKSLLCISELFPSDFKIISGLSIQPNRDFILRNLKGKHSGIDDKLKEMLVDERISNFKCITKSLWIVEQIENLIELRKIQIAKEKCKIIKCPFELAVSSYIDYLIRTDFSIGSWIGKREQKIERYIKKYKYRCKFLANYDIRESDFGEMSFIIAEYLDGTKKILFFVRDGSPRMKRVGLFSEERYIAEIFDQLFSHIWDQSKIYKIEDIQTTE